MTKITFFKNPEILVATTTLTISNWSGWNYHNLILVGNLLASRISAWMCSDLIMYCNSILMVGVKSSCTTWLDGSQAHMQLAKQTLKLQSKEKVQTNILRFSFSRELHKKMVFFIYTDTMHTIRAQGRIQQKH